MPDDRDAGRRLVPRDETGRIEPRPVDRVEVERMDRPEGEGPRVYHYEKHIELKGGVLGAVLGLGALAAVFVLMAGLVLGLVMAVALGAVGAAVIRRLGGARGPRLPKDRR